MHSPHLYSRRDLAVMAYVGGLLTGLIVGFASCESSIVLDSEGRCLENCR